METTSTGKVEPTRQQIEFDIITTPSSLPRQPFHIPASYIPAPSTVPRLEMSNRPSRPAGSARQPFRLLDLPRELLVPIVRSYRSPAEEVSIEAKIYIGEAYKERYRVLRYLCLTHRDILPFAQEELFKRITIRSNERINMLNRIIANSERCREYAGRAESISLWHQVTSDKLIESGVFNPRELYSAGTMKFSTLSRSSLATLRQQL